MTEIRGAFVVSLDFELHWGVRDRKSLTGPYRANLLGAREVIPRLLDLFDEFDIAATWATVGFLFANCREELIHHFPHIRPAYNNEALNPYTELLGEREEDDPLHYAPSLVSMIKVRQRQEIGTHTFSHYYCLETGQTEESFLADLKSAVCIAAKRGVDLKSIVFPRNQVNVRYLSCLKEVGITSYRGPEQGWMNEARSRAGETVMRRGARLADQYIPVSGRKNTRWEDVTDERGQCNVRSSMFLRPYSEALRHLDALRLARISSCIRHAAENGEIFHLWWHPHNCGVHIQENLAFLRRILLVVAHCRREYGMESLSMAGVANRVRSISRPSSRKTLETVGA